MNGCSDLEINTWNQLSTSNYYKYNMLCVIYEVEDD